MGKKIVLRGADFSAHAVKFTTWYQVNNAITSTGVGNGNTAGRSSYAGPLLKPEARNVPINLVRVNFGTLTMTVNSFTLGRFTLGDSISQIVPILTFSLDAADIANGYKIIKLPSPVVITQVNETIGVGLINAKGYAPVCYSAGASGVYDGLRGTSWGTGGIIANTDMVMSISYGYTEE